VCAAGATAKTAPSIAVAAASRSAARRPRRVGKRIVPGRTTRAGECWADAPAIYDDLGAEEAADLRTRVADA
jgi:hypothetical protein